MTHSTWGSLWKVFGNYSFKRQPPDCWLEWAAPGNIESTFCYTCTGFPVWFTDPVQKCWCWPSKLLLNILNPGYIQEQLPPYKPSHPLRSSSEALLSIPTPSEIRWSVVPNKPHSHYGTLPREDWKQTVHLKSWSSYAVSSEPLSLSRVSSFGVDVWYPFIYGHPIFISVSSC